MSDLGDFVVTWMSFDGSDSGIFGQRVSSKGDFQGNEFRVNYYTSLDQANPAIAMDDDGDFVVTWSSVSQDNSGSGVFARRYNSAGNALDVNEFQINTVTAFDQDSPNVAMDSSGNFTIVWSTDNQDGNLDGIRGQRYDVSGAKLGGEFQVNSWFTNNQNAPAIAMDADGDFSVIWQSQVQDGSNYGIYAQRFNANGTPIGTEFRVNTSTISDQRSAKIAASTNGDFVMAWQSKHNGTDTDIYVQRFTTNHIAAPVSNQLQLVDIDTTPVVFDLAAAWTDDEPYVNRTYKVLGITGSPSLITKAETFDQTNQLSLTIPTGTIGSATVTVRATDFGGLSVDNTFVFTVAKINDAPVFTKGGNIIINEGITAPQMHTKWVPSFGPGGGPDEASQNLTWEIKASNPGLFSSTPTLNANGDLQYTPAGHYGASVLQIRLKDDGGTAFGGVDTSAWQTAVITVEAEPGRPRTKAGDETLVNVFTQGNQQESDIAADDAGNYVIVWRTHPAIIGQRFNSNGQPIGPQFEIGAPGAIRQEPAVAMTADGAFVVTWWQIVGSESAVFCQRYDASGLAQGSPTVVSDNSFPFNVEPDVAVDSDGDFAISWSARPPVPSYYDVYVQRFNAAGTKAGSAQKANIFDGDASQFLSATAMDRNGGFVVVWDSKQTEGSTNGIRARRYDATGLPQGGEIEVNTYTTGNQQIPDIAMGANGEFVVTWSSEGQDGSESGVYAQQFNALGTPTGPEIRVNTFTTGIQHQARVAMDADGDFAIVWTSFNQIGQENDVFAQRFDFTGGKVGGEIPVNSFTTERQYLAAIASDAGGNLIATWSSRFQIGDGYEVYAQRFAPNTAPTVKSGADTMPFNEDTVGVLDLATVFSDLNQSSSSLKYIYLGKSGDEINEVKLDGSTLTITPNTDIYGQASVFVQAKDDFGATTDATITVNVRSVNDVPSFKKGPDIVSPSIYGAVSIPGWAHDISTGPANESSQTVEFEIGSNYDKTLFTASGQPSVSLDGTLTFDAVDGMYGAVVLTVRMYDSGGTANGGVDQSTPKQFVITIDPGVPRPAYTGGARVNDMTTGSQDGAVVATDAIGNFVVAWRSLDDIYMRRYSADRQPLNDEFRVNTFTSGVQTNPAIAMSPTGEFVITWRDQDQEADGFGVYGQRFSAAGLPLGQEFKVDPVDGLQYDQKVAFDYQGRFVIVWTRNVGGNTDVFARRYDVAGMPVGSLIPVNSVTTGFQESPSIAMTAGGDFLIAWNNGPLGGAVDVQVAVFDSNGTLTSGPMTVNSFTTGAQQAPSVAVDIDGDAVIAWQSQNQVAPDSGWDLYYRKMTLDGIDPIAEKLLNVYTTGDQTLVRIALDADGDMVAVWQSLNQYSATSGLDIYQRLFTYNGVGLNPYDVRVNRVTSMDQWLPSVASDADGDFVIAWQGKSSVDDNDVMFQRNTVFPQVSIPNLTIPSGGSTTFSLFDFYQDDPGSTEITNDNLYSITDIKYETLFDVNGDGKSKNEINEVFIDTKTGVLTIAARPDRHGNSPIGARVRDVTELPTVVTFNVTVEPSLSYVVPPSLPTGVLWTAMPNNSKSVEPGHSEGFSLFNEPFGMKIDAKTGVINWTPTSPATVTFTVRLTDFDGANPTDLCIDKSVTVIVTPAAPRVLPVVIGDGSIQRSKVPSLTVTFNHVVSFVGNAVDAFVVTRTGPDGTTGPVTIAGVDLSASTLSQTIAKLTFADGPMFANGSLVDGNYSLTVLASQVSANGLALDGNGDGSPGDDYTGFTFHRLFGDGDGNGTVTAADFNAFRLAYGSTGASIFDFNGDNQVSASDFNQFRTRYGITLVP